MSGLAWNEVDVLPLAKQFADPSWIASDWYLNIETNYRYLFQIIFGPAIVHFGFLATSIIGRLVCYALVAYGIVLLGEKLGLNLTYLLLATPIKVLSRGRSLENGYNIIPFALAISCFPLLPAY
ncbi:MAG: hypothetical protein AB4368_05145 [Xenococcaceae cyanobacterium]